jgi:hypothetical protein
MFSADAARRANEAAADVQTLRNMIFDPDIRQAELDKARIQSTEVKALT